MTVSNTIVHINGWPGTGKLTIARLLAVKLGAKLVDNHTLINPAEMLFGRRDPLHASLRRSVRETVFDHIARADPSGSFIFTDALADDAHDTAYFEAYRELAQRRKGELMAVVLDCSQEENLRRIVSAGRADRLKLTRPEVLRDLRSKHNLLRPAAAGRLIEIDVTSMTAEDVALALADKLF